MNVMKNLPMTSTRTGLESLLNFFHTMSCQLGTGRDCPALPWCGLTVSSSGHNIRKILNLLESVQRRAG